VQTGANGSFLATWDVEIGKIGVQEQPRQKVHKTLSTNSWVQEHRLVITIMCKTEIKRTGVPGQPGQKSSRDPISTENLDMVA
jgi:hypothetical protein